MALAFLAALAAAAGLASIAASPRVLPSETLASLVMRGLASILLTFLAALIAARGTFRFTEGHGAGRDQRRRIAVLAAGAAWLTPTLLLLRVNSPWSAAAALAGIAFAMPATRARLDAAHGALSFTTSLSLQAGVLALALDRYVPAVLILSAAAGITALRWNPSDPGRLRAPVALTAAILVMLAFLIRGFADGVEARWGSRRNAAVPVYAAADSGAPAKGKHAADPGVLLYPEKEPPRLPEPPRPSSAQSRRAEAAKPLEIPFSGVYWYFYAPWLEPPPSSAVLHGTADKFRFRTVDKRNMRMQARQNLGRTIPLSCCSQLDMWIRNADRHADTVHIEVELVHTPTGEAVSLGRLPVKSTQLSALAADPAREKLTYSLRPAAGLKAFDEFRVTYHLGFTRHGRGAPIAVERFVLPPRF